MSAQYVNFSYALPAKFYKNTSTPGGHMDDDWAKSRIKRFETQTCYPQRWQVGDETTLQITSTIVPDTLKIYNSAGVEVDDIAWTEVLSGVGLKVYELQLNLDTAYASGANKTLYLYQKVELMDTLFEAISEPISIKTLWPNTIIFEYKNSFDTFDLFFTTGATFRFRIEAGIMDYEPGNESADFVDEIHNGELLSATVFDAFKLYIGDARGVADWALKILNFIVHCDNWKIEIQNSDAKQYVKVSGAKWDINRVKGWPLFGASIDIMPASNLYSLQLNADTLEPGIVTGMMLQTNFFGESIEEVQVEQIDIIE